MIPESRVEEILQKLKFQKPILVIGDVGIDKYTYGEVLRISPEAPVPVLEVTKEWLKLGLAANIVDNLTAIGVSSTLCGLIGEDSNAMKFENLLEEIGLKTWGLVRSHSHMTTVKERITTSLQQICRVDYENKEDIGPDQQLKILNKINDFKFNHGPIIIQDYGKGLVTDSLCRKIIELAQKEKIPVYVDPYRTKHGEIYKNASLIKPNLLEAKVLASNLGVSTHGPLDIAMGLSRKMEIDQVAITLGGEGLCVYDKKNMTSPQIIPTISTEVFDVSGAGDTALSALVACLGAGATLIESAWLANCASGVVVGKKGTATANVEEISLFYRRMQEEWGKHP